ncbi:MAG: hypothetical protein R3F48_05935 [Candidatus Zixiibacteriota bacterium]
MSLTKFIKFTEVKEGLKKYIKKPRISLKAGILAPPLTDNSVQVGIAFDYLLRFLLKRINPRAIVGRWIAENDPPVFGTLPYLIGQDDFLEMMAQRDDLIRLTKKKADLFVKDGKLHRSLIRNCLIMSQYDLLIRTGRVYYTGGEVNEKDIRDLKKLIEIVPLKTLKAKKVCALNPTFGKASQIVRGADADIILDKCIIDIKTVRSLTFKRDYFDQLIGYYLLQNIGGIDGIKGETEIDSIGIYFSRFALMYKINISECIDVGQKDKLVKWFKKMANKYYTNRYAKLRRLKR